VVDKPFLACNIKSDGIQRFAENCEANTMAFLHETNLMW